jgi:RimJ/RimL family protein N-acetyltransferase
MRHLMPIVTPRLVLRPPTLGDLDSIQTAKEDAWPDLQRWMAWVAPKYAGQGMATEAANAAIRYAFGHLGAKAICIGYFDGNEASRRIVEKLGFQKPGVARQAATRCLDGGKLDRHQYILTSANALPELDVSWG